MHLIYNKINNFNDLRIFLCIPVKIKNDNNNKTDL